MVWYKVMRFSGNTLTTSVRLPDLGRNQKMMFNSCHIHRLYAQGNFRFCHNECVKAFKATPGMQN